MPSLKDKLVWNLKKIFHKPTVQIGKANVLLYLSIILIFIIALVIRLLPSLRYASELRALDPYTQFKAARYIVEHGLPAYFSWHETMSWFPTGVYMGPYLYLGTPLSGVFFYYFFHFLGVNLTIYDACVVAPAIEGALSCIAMYFFGKELAGNKKTGLLAAFFLALCVGFQSRTITGFYDNEPIGILGMIIFFFFFLKTLKTGSIPYSLLSGFGLGLLSVSWGSYTYIWDLLPLSVFLLILLKRYSSRLLLAYGVTISVSLLAVVLQPTTGPRRITGGEAMINFGVLGLCLLIEFYRRFKVTATYKYFKTHWKSILRLSLFGLLVLLIITSITGALQTFLSEVVGGQLVSLTGGRYLVAMFPWISSLTIQSVAEHMPSAWGLFYYNYEFLLFLFPLGLYFLFKRLYEEDVFVIVFGLTTVYFASSMSRLHMVFAPAICIIAAFGLASLIKPFSLVIRKKFLTVRRRKRTTTIVTREISVAIFSLMFFFLLFTSVHGIYNAAYQLAQPGMGNDWRETFAWMRANLNHDDVVVSWWDYGYQITTVGEVTTVIDNGTWNNTAMGMVGRQFMADDELESIKILKSQWQADYVLVSWSYFYPNGGGDEGKWQWMIRIAYEQLKGTPWAINISDRWNETSYKPTCEFFDTTLWKMLTYYEPFIDYDQDEGNAGVIKWLIQNGYPLGYFLARLNWADPWAPDQGSHSGQWEDDSGHLWKYHNPPLGQGLVDDGYVNYDNDPDDDTVGQFMNLEYFSPVFFSAGHLVKVFKIDYEKTKLRAEISDNSQLFNNSVAKLTINNTGELNLDIESVKINDQTVPFVPISTMTSGIEPGDSAQIKAYGPSLPLGAIKKGSSYPVEVTVRSGGYTYTATKELISEPAPYVNMSVDESGIQVLSNETILVPITNTGDDYLEIASVQVGNETSTNFGTYSSSIGEHQVDIDCNFTDSGFFPTNITATEGNLVNFHVTNLVPATTIKFGLSDFDKEIQISYGQTQILSLEATKNGTFPFYCYNILWPPANYTVGNLTLLEDSITEHWDYKFIPVNQTEILKIHSSKPLIPNELVNLTISTNPNENITREFSNLQVYSGSSCVTLINANAYANETVYLTVKNTGANNETIDHVWLNGEIFDIYTSPNPHGLAFIRNQTIDFTVEFDPTVLNLNITSPYDPLPLQLNVTLLNSPIMDPESEHGPSVEIHNNYALYNISITDEIYSNETAIINVTNVGLKSIQISDFQINNVSTTVFSPITSPIIAPAATEIFNITSLLNLNFLETASIMARTFEGPYAIINRTVGLSGALNITWSEAYQNNQTIFINVSNTRGTPVTIKSIFLNSTEVEDFTPLDVSFNPLPNSFNTISGLSSQLFNVTMSYSQFTTLNLNSPLLLNLTTYEGSYTEHNVTWAYAMNINQVYAFNNNTVITYLQNVGRYPITINCIYLNSSSTSFTVINGSSTPAPGTISIFKMSSGIPLLFGNSLTIEAIANYTSSLENISASYSVSSILSAGPNITILSGWPYTVVFDNSSASINDSVYITIMNTGNTTFNLANIYLNGTLHVFNRTDNISSVTFAPYERATFVKHNISIPLSAKNNDYLEINVTTDLPIDTTHNLSSLQTIRVLYDKPNITVFANAIYSALFDQTIVIFNLTNYGDTPLTINLENDLSVNYTAEYPSGILTINPDEFWEDSSKKISIRVDPPTVGEYIIVQVTAWYGTSSIVDDIIIPVYAG
ncbi:MAG: STT3 domain-containing protein [Candidatus Helarchaeota archaeon]